MKVLVSHPTVNAFVRALVEGLEKRGILSAFCTTLARGRRAVRVHRDRVTEFPVRELARLLASRCGWSAPVRHEYGWASVDQVYRDLDRRVAGRLARGLAAVYAYEDGALETFRTARRLGVRCYYELPIAYWKTCRCLLEEEAQRLPQWAATLGGTLDSEEKLRRKTEELELADLIICPSEFVRRSLPPGVRSVLARFGSPEVDHPRSDRPVRSPDPLLRVLFVGSMSQRKGLGDLFEAMRILGRRDVRLTVLGSPQVPMSFYRGQFAGFDYEAPRKRAAVFEVMGRHDLLALPSIVEGRALVQQEALSCGLPILVTPNAGGEDLVVERETGFLVPIRSPELIAERIAWLADHREAIGPMRENARRMARSLTWQGYVETIVDALT